jgi:protein AbiQ
MRFVFLTSEFYDAYKDCPEIEQKRTRPYTQVVITVNNLTFAIPLRSNINHPHVLWTDKANKCGLDFSKAVIILDPGKYVDNTTVPHIRQSEFDSLRGKEHIVKTKMEKYIKDYKKAKTKLHIPQNKQLCRYSTMQYFEDYI